MKQAERVALITGANKGMGLEIGRQLGRAGITVLLGTRSLERGSEAARALHGEGIDARAIQLDVTDEASVAAAAEQILDRFGSLDILVNNAGINQAGDGRPGVASVDAVRRLLETNFVGALTVTQAMLPLLRRGRAARIINMSSSLGSLKMNGDPTSPYYRAQLIGYNASKAALNMLTVQLAQELGDAGIAVNAACPGFVKTDLNGNTGVLSVAEGVETPVRLALVDISPSGQFLNVRGQVPW
jgi:NAD(P)-dependent dehydrogenase (short-subunit alcohol dehydrogenase family)